MPPRAGDGTRDRAESLFLKSVDPGTPASGRGRPAARAGGLSRLPEAFEPVEAPMTRLFIFILVLAVTSCVCVGIIVALSLGQYSGTALLLWGGGGAVIGVPVGLLAMRILRKREAEH